MNHNLTSIITPVNVEVLQRLLKESNYDKQESEFLVNGFKYGFDLEYQGPWNRQDTSRNIPFQVGVGDKWDMWSKIMKEVKAKRYAGPYKQIPYKYYVQSPIGLVPKAGNKTRLIFHLSYDFGDDERQRSINYFTPEKFCTVKYNDIDCAVQLSLKMIRDIDSAYQIVNTSNMLSDSGDSRVIFYSKTDLMSAFRILPLRPNCYCLLILKARNPITNEWEFYVEKNLPFGHSISCSHFQRFSNGLRHIYEHMLGVSMISVNYIDDFLFLAPSQAVCNARVRFFLNLCEKLGIPVALEKTEWARTEIVFLGILLDGKRKVLDIPEDKRTKALGWLNHLLGKKSCTVKELEKFTGILNFLTRAVVPGRTFTRRMYAKFSGAKKIGLKPYHHVRLDGEFKKDCAIWKIFLHNNRKSGVPRPFIDFYSDDCSAKVRFLLSDATTNENLGFGVLFNTSWTYQQWEKNFIARYQPSIEFLELYALCIGVFTWSLKLKNSRFILFCDNESVCNMIKNSSSGCKYCMTLIRKLVLRSLEYNFRVFSRHILGADNFLSDSLSRMDLVKFRRETKKFGINADANPTSLNGVAELWPLSRYWENNCKNLQ